MDISYDILIQGNNLRLRDDFLGLSSVVLLTVSGEHVLFDTGGYISRLGLLKRLAERGLNPGDIGTVFLSHLHFDHAHNVDLFPDATFIVSRAEWNYAANPHPEDLMMPWGIREELSRRKLQLIEGEGEIRPGLRHFPAPGHTPGCTALQFGCSGRGNVVIAGDAIKYAKEAITGRCDMAFDTIEAGTASIRRILDVADRIVPGHFQELIRLPNGNFTWDSQSELALVIR